MALLIFGIPLLLLGVTMMIRGWTYTVKPDGAMAQKRKKVNLKRGMTTDMKVFGRKVRRLGLILVLLGGTLVGWHASHRVEAAQGVTTTAAG
ncbi:MAG TPA: hypothetical protein VGF99_07105 [Myxococcota bacterium]